MIICPANRDASDDVMRSAHQLREQFDRMLLIAGFPKHLVTPPPGYFFRGSSQIDMLWIPVQPKQGRKPGNERGNPHVDVDEVLAIWRDSVPADVRNKWPVIDPPAADRIADTSQIAGLVPVQQQPVAEVDQVATADDATPEDADDDTAEETVAGSDENAAAESTESDSDAEATEDDDDAGEGSEAEAAATAG